jgi:hypothetical protein
MMKVKPVKTLGYVFAILTATIFLVHTCVLLSHGDLVSLKTPVFIFYIVAFLVTAYLKRTIALYSQAALIYILGVLSFYSESSPVAFAVLLVSMSASLLFAAGFYAHYGWPKVGILAAVNMLVLTFGPLMGKEHGVIIAIQWTVFITAYCLILRVLFSDEIDRLNEIEDKVEAKYMRLLGEATEIAREALDILHGLKDKVDRG